MSEIDVNKALPKNFDESLINLVRLNPLLYAKEKRMKPYESIREKSDLWKSIATTLGVEPNFCMIRWKHLVERYRRECQILRKKQSPNKAIIAMDPLLEKMSFLDSYVSCSRKLGHMPNGEASKSNITSFSRADEMYSGVNYEYLPEAMEAQSSTNLDNATRAGPQMFYNSATTSTNSVLVRIKALLEGLDPINRGKAEKRVLSYLCKCQLKALENESIDDICL